MDAPVIKIESVSKQYRLGQVGTGTISHDLNRWWHRLRGKDDPYLKVGETNDRTSKGVSDYVWALNDISFDVKQGEVLGIIGRNGAGKSTLLKILSRVTQPSSGAIHVRGRIASLLEVGTGFHPELTGRENIFLNGAILGMSKHEIRSKFDEIVAFSGVEKYIDTPVKRYSSGMYVRLAFAVAAHLEPEILIVDEVLAVGDAEFQKKCLGKMKDVSTQGRTVLFVSHNMLAIKSLCTSGVWLHNGTVESIGGIEQVVDAYLTRNTFLLNSKKTIGKQALGFTLNQLSISDNGISGNFNIHEDLVFTIDFECLENQPAININLFFHSIEGNLIFATCSQVANYQVGCYQLTCTIPANTLNDNLYRIDLMVVANESKPIMAFEEVLIIEGVEERRNSPWLDKFPGLIRPLYFNWNLTQLHA